MLARTRASSAWEIAASRRIAGMKNGTSKGTAGSRSTSLPIHTGWEARQPHQHIT